MSKGQLYKIQEVLRHPSQYQDRLQPEDRPVTRPYASTFNKFLPNKIEVNEATLEEAVQYGQYLKRSENNITEAINNFWTLGDDASYGPKELPDVEPQEEEEQWLPTQYNPDAYYTTVQNSACRQLDCFTIALGKGTGRTFPITFQDNQNYNALYDTGAGTSLINYTAYVALGKKLDTGYQPYIKKCFRTRHGCTRTSNLYFHYQ